MILLERELMRKIWIFMLLACMTLLSSQTFWYFEDRVYCDIKNNNVTIFLNNDSWLSKCKVYMDAVYQLAQKKYNEILTIRSYIDQWDDVYYWNWVLENKKAELLKLVNYRTQIKTAIDKFETTFFNKYQETLQSYMKVYYSDLETQYYILINQDQSLRTYDHFLRVAQLEQQMWNVSRVLNAEKLDDIMDVMSSYIYLKQQLRWR